MRINWLNFKFIKQDGYGRYGMNMVRALVNAGVEVMPGITSQLDDIPGWMQAMSGFDWSNLTIQCLPAMMAKPVPGRVWILSMTENTGIPADWSAKINQIAERLIVPCEHNAAVFKARGVTVPISVVPGGTSPGEFPVVRARNGRRPYTFLAMADRAPRKGMELVWSAFYKAFPTEDVRLIIKARPSTLSWLNTSNFSDRRVSFWKLDVDNMADVFAQTDCFVFPSYGEGWGMPPREAAMMGLPVIATRWSGLEVGIDNWAIPLDKFTLGPAQPEEYNGEWAICDLDEIVEKMRWCYDNQEAARQLALRASAWLRENQTWEHSAAGLVELMESNAS